MLLPILLDLLILAAPGVRSEALSASASALVVDVVAQQEATNPASSAFPTPETLKETATRLGQWNLLGLLNWQVPSLREPLAPVFPTAAARDLGSLNTTFAFGFGAMLLGLLLGCYYLGRIADAVAQTPRGAQDPQQRPVQQPINAVPAQPRTFGSFLRTLVINFAHLSSLRVLQLFGILFFSLLAALASKSLVLWVLAGALAIMAWIYTFLAEEAVFLGKRSAMQALRESVRVVKDHFRATLLLWLLVLAIPLGIRQLLGLMAADSLGGTWLAIAGNAYIATGLTAAVLVFYHDRGILATDIPDAARTRT